MVLVPEGPVWMQETSDASDKVPAFYIDRYEYPNVAGRAPTVNVSSVMQAAEICRTQGKQLCSPYQWLRACMGDERRDYPYGKDYLGGACSAGYDPSVQKEPFPNGWFPACRTKEGIFDMSGNISEWTALDDDTGFLYGGDVFTGVEKPKLQLSCQRSRKRMEASNTSVAGVRCCKPAK
jgi:formylglycine-generating enzyme required for sulfatase activity